MRTTQQLRNELNQAIDFDVVLKQIASFASFSCSLEAIQNAMPYHDLIEIRHQLDLAQEAIELERQGTFVNMGGCSDISLFVQQAEKQMVLQGTDLNAVVLFLLSVRNVQQGLSETVLLKELAETMNSCSRLVHEIQKMVDGTGQIKEDATPKLRSCHKQLVEQRLTLQEKGRQFVKRNHNKLMENMTTTIGGRLSVLVKAQDKNAFGGMVHGQSQSGQAYYIEPGSFVENNNKIQNLEIEIEEEKKRICKQLTKAVAKEALQLQSNLETMTMIDVALAKGKWAYHFDGCIPVIQTRSSAFYFEYARHPLIDMKKVVANTYSCKANENCLMISGPNMGGKTVTLKTIGLFVVLAHCGFPVISHHASLPFYQSFWFDIGDQQSIENNLSTFSSHISKIALIVKKSNAHSFILIDELGNGTDPLEGASLAIAILDTLIQKQCTIITTTHYNQVKAYGKANPHVLVSSVEFNSQTLQPTYRYIPGVSGASYAFDIAAQYDLNPAILDKAKAIKAENTQNIDKELERLEMMQNAVRKEKDRFDQLIKNAHDIQRKAQEEEKKVERRKAFMDEAYQDQLNAMLEEKQEEARKIIAELKSSATPKMHEKTALLHQLNIMSEPKKHVEHKSEPLKVGDYVQVEGLNSHGEIVDIRKKEATIVTNGMKMTVKLNRLHKITKPNVKKKVPKMHIDHSFKRFPLECNVIGMHVDEALRTVDDYLDAAIAHRVKQVRIVHGLGSGALRNAIWKDLEKHPAVKGKSAAGQNEGGLGATIVQLK